MMHPRFRGHRPHPFTTPFDGGPGFGPGFGQAMGHGAGPEDGSDDTAGTRRAHRRRPPRPPRGRGGFGSEDRGFGFGPGAPGPGGFGPWAGPGPHGRRGRRSNRGDIRLAVLDLLTERPRHGYEIIQEIRERTGDAWRPSPGSVYPTLSQLQDEGLIGATEGDGRRVVHLTDAGRAWVADHRAELAAVWDSGTDGDAEGGATDEARATWEELGQLHAATRQVLAAGSPEQVSAAGTALAEARRAIYRLLAE